MADPNALYSYQGQEPKPLPHEISWVEEWGQITYRTDVSSFTDEELAKAGYTGPYEVLSINAEYQRLRWDSEVVNYIVEDISDEELWEKVRTQRNNDLKECDWTMVADIPSVVNKKEWNLYRQRLRDLPSLYTNPKDALEHWPESPEGKSDDDFDTPRVFEEKITSKVDNLMGDVQEIFKRIEELKDKIKILEGS